MVRRYTQKELGFSSLVICSMHFMLVFDKIRMSQRERWISREPMDAKDRGPSLQRTIALVYLKI